MSKKIRTRSITADNGTKIRMTTVTNGRGQVVDDPRNGFQMLDADGRVVAAAPVSAGATRATKDWFNAAA